MISCSKLVAVAVFEVALPFMSALISLPSRKYSLRLEYRDCLLGPNSSTRRPRESDFDNTFVTFYEWRGSLNIR